MGGPLSVTLADIHIIQMETDIVFLWYQFGQYFPYDNRMTYIISAQKNTIDKLYDGLNNYHSKIKLTIETNLLRFLDAEIIHINSILETWVHTKKTKLPTPFTYNIPKRYKQHNIKRELHWAKPTLSNFTNEVTLIRNKFKSKDYPSHFVNSIIHEFTTAQTNENNELIIPPWLFEVKKITLVKIPYGLKNERSSKQFIKKFDKFTNDTIDVQIKWLTRKVKTLIRVKDNLCIKPVKFIKVIAHVVRKYIGKTIGNVEVCWDEHKNPMKMSNLSKHNKDNLNNVFNWSVLAIAPRNMFQQGVLHCSRKTHS